MEPAYVGAYWARRPESADECAVRLARCLDLLAEIDPALTAWFQTGTSRAAATTPVGRDTHALAELLRRGRNRRDDNGEAIEALGFRVAMWNRTRPEVGLRATVGMTSGLNAVVLQLPVLDEGPQLYRRGAAAAVMKAVVESWGPTWATWTTDGWREAQLADPGQPTVGWLTYLSHATPADIPADVASLAMADGGLVSAAPTFSAVTEERVLAVREVLTAGGLLGPTGSGQGGF